MKMIVKQATDLGKCALENPKKYKGFMGISIQHKFFSKKNMSYFCEYCSELFSEFTIVLMDDPDHYNFMVFKDLPKEEALKKSRKISDEVKKGYERVLKTLGLKNTKIVQFKDFIDDKKYRKILSEIKMFMKKNEDFKDDLYELMEVGIGNKIIEFAKEKNLLENKLLSVQKTLSQYIIEELATVIYFTERGHTIEIDPTREFSTKKFIYEGRFPEFYKSLGLSQRGHLYIHPEGITKNSY